MGAGGIASNGISTSRDVAAVQSTNNTTHYFIGAPQRSWMNAAAGSGSSCRVPRPNVAKSSTASEAPPPRRPEPNLVTEASTSTVVESSEAHSISLPISTETSAETSISSAEQREGQQVAAERNADTVGGALLQTGSASGTTNASTNTVTSATTPLGTQPPCQTSQFSPPVSNTQVNQPSSFGVRIGNNDGGRMPRVAAHASAQQASPPANGNPTPSSIYSVPVTRKRPSDTNPGPERRIRNTNDRASGPTQLPTPHDSPIAPTTTVLAMLLDSAIGTLNPPLTATFPPTLDQCRLSMLRGACQANDIFYVLAHLAYCTWTAAQHIVLASLNLTQAQALGLQILPTILGLNQYLSKEVYCLFLNFPRQIHLYVKELSVSAAASVIQSFKDFLSCLGFAYEGIKNTALQRGFPPCPTELQLQLRLPSPILQKAIFRTILRHRTSHEAWIERATALFEQAMNDPAQSASQPTIDGATNGAIVQCSKSASIFRQSYFTAYEHFLAGTVAAAGQLSPEVHQNLFADYRAGLQQAQAHHTLTFPYHQSATSGGNVLLTLTPNPSATPGQPQPQPGHYPPQQPQMVPQFTYRGPPGQRYAAQPSFRAALPNERPVSTASAPVLPSSPTASTSFGPLHSIPAQPSNMPSNMPQPSAPISRQQTQPSAPISRQQTSISNQAQSTPTQPGGGIGRGPAVAPPQLLPPQVVPSPRARQASRSLAQALFPPADFVLPTLACPDPDRNALHQAHLRSPEYIKVDAPEGKPETRYYQYVEDIIELPQTLGANPDLVRWNVHIPRHLWVRKAETLSPTGELLARRRNIWNGCVQFRLKCISFEGSLPTPRPTLSDFCVRSTKWPQYISVSINGDMGVDFRRKVHYGVDLPTDVTDLLKEGDNEVVISISSPPAEAQRVYLMAIEIICISNHDTILKIPGRIEAKEALSNIIGALKRQRGDQAEEDGDIVIVQPSLSIDLMDPFTSVMWVTPVRGKECQHRECFDLESFLQSRTSRDGESGVTNPDQWKCPICNKDARPPMLAIDEFMLEVRKLLEQRNQLEVAKAIMVTEEGFLGIKLDRPVSSPTSSSAALPTTTASSASTPTTGIGPQAKSQEVAAPAAAAATPSSKTPSAPRRATQIIVLDDDDD